MDKKNFGDISAIKVGISYLNSQQIKKGKGAKILYESLELKEYLNSWSNLKLGGQRFLLSIGTEMNPSARKSAQARKQCS